LLICLLACCQRVKNKIILPLDNATNRLTCEGWVKHEGGRIYKVTVDCPKAPFSHDLIRWMARQAGVSKKAFYEALDK
jgi:hypothetical protein